MLFEEKFGRAEKSFRGRREKMFVGISAVKNSTSQGQWCGQAGPS